MTTCSQSCTTFSKGRRYGVIYADPPWHFRNWSTKGTGRNAISHYDCIDFPALAALPVAQLAAPNCVLFLWATDPFLPRALDRKPDCVRERIERLVPGPYLELFARETKEGWDCWGNQVGLFDHGPVRTRRQPSRLVDARKCDPCKAPPG